MDEQKIKILYAEDDTLCAELTKHILEKEGFEVKTTADGAQAWNAYRENRPDLLLLDLDMPEKDGLEVTRLVREHDTQTHIIVYTTHSEPAKEIAILDAGADEFVCKERSPEVLVAHLNHIRTKILQHKQTPHLFRLSEHTTYQAATRILTIDGSRTEVKPTDGRMLQLLCAKRNEVAKREYLVQGIWGNASMNKDPELKKYASHVRTLLKDDPSLTLKYTGDGYILTDATSATNQKHTTLKDAVRSILRHNVYSCHKV